MEPKYEMDTFLNGRATLGDNEEERLKKQPLLIEDYFHFPSTENQPNTCTPSLPSWFPAGAHYNYL